MKRPQLDPDIKGLFLAEAEQKASEIYQGIAEWQSKPERADKLVWLQLRFAEYAGLAKTLGLQRSGKACSLVVDEITRILADTIDADDSLTALFDQALTAIDHTLEHLHGDEVEPALLYDSDDFGEPTVAEQLPEIEFQQVGKESTQTRNRPETYVTQAIPKDIDHDIFGVYLQEAQELLDLAEQAWEQWQQGNNIANAISELRRVFHTLKGGARLTQMFTLGDYVHHAENWMQSAGSNQLDSALLQRTRRTIDSLQEAFVALGRGQPAQLQTTLKSNSNNPSPAEPTTAPSQPKPSSGNDKDSTIKTHVRVSTHLLEVARQRASEVNALRNQVQQLASALNDEQQISAGTIAAAADHLRHARAAIEYLIQKLPTQVLAELTDQQLESQMMLQSMEQQLLQINRQLHRSADISSHIDRALVTQGKASFALQQQILTTRLVAFAEFESRLQRILRQSCEAESNKGLEKKAELQLQGGHLHIDRDVVEQLLPALEHMLRNAVAHGIETQAERRKLGKPPAGRVTVRLEHEHSQLLLTVSDDGSGLDLPAIRAKAESMGLVAADESLDSRQTARLIFNMGLSAKKEVDQLAGRGVGMDIVEHSVHAMSGSVDINSRTGEGTSFIIRLPLHDNAIQAILVYSGDEAYAVAQDDVECILRVDDQTLSQAYQHGKPITWKQRAWQLRSLDHWLGLGEGSLPAPGENFPALLVSSKTGDYAVVAERCEQSAEHLLEPLPSSVSGIPGIAAAIILGDGRIAPVLDIPALCALNPQYSRQRLQPVQTEIGGGFHIMAVDDSITWRRQLRQTFEDLPVTLTLSQDGQEALKRLEQKAPDLLILDLEMPTMDGLEFLQRMKRQRRFHHIPVLMFSTSTISTQRRRAKQLGATAWVQKSSNVAALLNAIDKQLNTDFSARVAQSQKQQDG